MGELSKNDAQSKCTKYIGQLKKIKKYVYEDFTEMDFKNAKPRTDMEIYVNAIQTEFDKLIETLNSITFE